MFSNFFFPEIVPFMRYCRILEPGRPQMTIWRMRVVWISKATDTHSEYVILIAFPLQQWLHKHTTIIRTLPILFKDITKYPFRV